MKTVEEFIQRLQDDPAFEKQAQAFDHGDDLIAFVKREGYDFTLEDLMSEFERAEKSPGETGDLAPPPANMSPSPSPIPDAAEFPSQPETLSGKDSATDLPTGSNNDFPRETPVERVTQPEAAMPPPETAVEPRAGLFRGGGGRHRGFSPERLKATSEEET
jgi:predicted ribosomally synthesized peptide with nif11-like leader